MDKIKYKYLICGGHGDKVFDKEGEIEADSFLDAVKKIYKKKPYYSDIVFMAGEKGKETSRFGDPISKDWVRAKNNMHKKWLAYHEQEIKKKNAEILIVWDLYTKACQKIHDAEQALRD